MSTPTTARGALLARAGALLVAAALISAPATSAFADPTASTTTSPTADAVATASMSTSPTPTATGSPSPTTTPTSEPTPTTSGSATDFPSPSGQSRSGIAPNAKAGLAPLLPASGDQAAAAFIASTLAAGGDHYVYPKSTYFDGGNTIDAIIALSAVGTQQAQSASSLDYLAKNLGTYIGAGGEAYAGPLAKTLLATVVTGADPRSFGDHDLIAELQALETTKGRFSDDSGYGDYSNTIGQSLAVLGLSRAGQGLNALSVQTLLDQQCADGGFRGTLEASDGCVSDADATAFAVQALLVAGNTLLCGTAVEGLPAEAAAAAQGGLGFLADGQDAEGGFASDDGAVNANTTAVAAQAFAAGGRTAAAAAARTFIATLQYDGSAPAPLRGGIAFSADTRSTTVPTDSDLRATPQATLALAGGSLVDAVAPGVEGAAPASTCPPAATRQPVPVVDATTTPSSSTDPPTDEDGDPIPAAGGPDPSVTLGSVTTGSLARTGSDLMVPAVLGLLLVLAGGLAVWSSSRRRGAHS